MEEPSQLLEKIRQLFLSLDPSTQAMEELETHFDALLEAVNNEAENDNSEDDDYMDWVFTIIYLGSWHQTGRF